jgi:hypothetical protein
LYEGLKQWARTKMSGLQLKLSVLTSFAVLPQCVAAYAGSCGTERGDSGEIVAPVKMFGLEGG